MQKIISVLLFFSSLLFAMSSQPKNSMDYHIIGINTKKKELTFNEIKTTLQEAGLIITEELNINESHSKEDGKNSFKSYHLLSYYHKEISPQLTVKYPNAALFFPSHLAIYQKKGDPFIWVSFLTASKQGRILGLKKREVLLEKVEMTLLNSLIKLFKTPSFDNKQSSRVQKMKSIELQKVLFKSSADLKNIQSALQTSLEEKLKERGFSFKAAMDLKEEKGMDADYDFYISYSVSHLKTIHSIKNAQPEVGAFFPFTLVLYKKRDTNIVNIAYIDIANLIDSSNISDNKSLKALNRLEKEMDSIIRGLIHKR